MTNQLKIGGVSYYDGIQFISNNIQVFVKEKSVHVKIRSKSTLANRLQTYAFFAVLLISAILSDVSQLLPSLDIQNSWFGGSVLYPLIILIYGAYFFANIKTYYGLIMKSDQIRQFHGAEHKAINAYYIGDYSLKGIYSANRVADRCGTNIAVNLIVVYLIVRFCLTYWHIPLYTTISLLSAIVFSIYFFDNEKNPLKKSGDFAQKWITTKEPTSMEVKIAKRGMDLLLKAQALYDSNKLEEIEALNQI